MELGININIGSTIDNEFKGMIASIPYKLKDIQGIGELDPFILSDKFFNAANVADSSIDPNANMSGKSPVSFQSEVFKPQLKYRSFYEMWSRVRNKWGVVDANSCISSCIDGGLYFHDITKIDQPYCFAFDTSFMLIEGRPYGWLPSTPPKRSSSFMSQLVECTMDMSQEHAGAIGIANLIVSLAYFTRKERREIHRQIKDYAYTCCDQPLQYLKMGLSAAITIYMAGLGCDLDLIKGDIQALNNMTCDNKAWCESDTVKFKHDIVEAAIAISDKVYDKYVQNLFQNFVHIMHNTFRTGGDSPFTNLSLFDKLTLRAVFDVAKYPDYSSVVDNYEEIDHLQRIFIEFFHTGSPITGKNYRFPVVSVNIKTNSEGVIEDKDFFRYVVLKNKKRGAFNIHVGEKVATCCRLTSDLAALKDMIRMDTFGNGGLSIGSHRVVAVNLHRMALIAKYNSRAIESVIEEYLVKAEKLLVAHKELLSERCNQKFLKFFNIHWQDLKMFFSTIGYTGLIDAYAVYSGKSIDEIMADDDELDEYVYFANDIISKLEDFATQAGKRNEGYAFNVEEIPAENASPKLAQADNYLYGDYQFDDEADMTYHPVELLSNQMIPLYCNLPLYKRLEVSGKLMNKVSGGSILHLNLTEQVTDEAYVELVTSIIEDYKIPHFALNVGSTTCVNGHTTPGIYLDVCPQCGAEIDYFTIRVVGFATDTKDWSAPRREEFFKRQLYGAKDLTTKNIL